MGQGTIELQRKLQLEAYGIEPEKLDGEELADFVRWNVLAAVDELCEALHEVKGWKPWSSKQPDQLLSGTAEARAFIEELVDVQHFINNLLLCAGCTDGEFHTAYKKKAEINLQRQKDNYAR